MRTHSNTIAVLALVLGLASACASRPTLPPGVIVGLEMQPREVIHLAVIDADPEPYWNRTLLIEATVTAVCQKKGCWMQIEDQGSRAMVRWESGCGGEYTFPKDLEGKRILIQGSIYDTSISEDDAEHLEEEAGRPISIDRQGREINASAILVVGAPS
ncbi:MAG: DUF4920 domain-containing protein [Planctomycetota bacterium]